MFEVMDSNKESLDRLEAEKNELEDLWKQEKDKLRAAQRVRAGVLLYSVHVQCMWLQGSLVRNDKLDSDSLPRATVRTYTQLK